VNTRGAASGAADGPYCTSDADTTHRVQEEELEEVREALLAYTRKILEVADVDLTDDFMAIGGDSLSAVMLANAVERDYRIELPMHVIFDAGSLNEIADFISNAESSSAPAE
jgi:acyl carrier protein